MHEDTGLDILVVGTGMYVCGRGTDGYGTVLPAIYEWNENHGVRTLHVAGTSPDSVGTLQAKQAEIEAAFDAEIDTEYYPTGAPDDEAYLTAADRLSDPCCAMVVVPDHLHRDVTADLIEREIHPFVVKPLAPTLEEVDELLELQAEYNVHGAVDFHKRFDRSNRMLRDAYSADEVGDPLYFLVQYSQRKSVPAESFESWVDRTNIFQYLGPHYVDIIRFVTGARPVRVDVSGQRQYLAERGVDTYDAIEVMVEWERDDGHRFQSCFLTNWIDPERTSAMSDQRITLVGTGGRFEADQKRRGIQQVTDEKGVQEPNPDFCSSYGTPGADTFTFEGYGIDSFHSFLADVHRQYDEDSTPGQNPSVVTFEEARVSTAVIEAVNECLVEDRDGTAVKL